MKLKIKRYFENLDPKKLGLDKIKVKSVKKIGMGTSNANFVVDTGKKKFVFRLNMHPKNRTKIKNEFKALKLVEDYNITPKPILLDVSKKIFDSEFMIQSYIQGKTAEQLKIWRTDKGLKELAKLLTKIHSIRIKGDLKKLKKFKPVFEYKRYLKHQKKFYIKYIKKHVKNKNLISLIDGTYAKLKKDIPEDIGYNMVISQGDFCEGNIIISKNRFYLVDFESLGIENQFSELAFILVTFKGTPFNKQQKKIFLQEYKRQMKIEDKNFDKKIQAWIPILQFTIFLWAIKHVLRSKNKEFHSHFLESNSFKEDLEYAQIVLKNSIKLGLIDKKYKDFDIKKAL